MAVDFSGTWKLDSSRRENFNNFMEAYGVSAADIQVMSEAVILKEMTQTADGILMKITTPKGITKCDLFFGKETEFTTVYGKKAKGCVAWEGSKLVFKWRTDDREITKCEKELINGEMSCIMETSTDVKCKSIYIKM